MRAWWVSSCIGKALAIASQDDLHTITFFVKQSGAEQIIEHALAVSNPSSERYGDFLTFEDVVALQRPAQGSLDKVNEFLDRLGALDRRVSPAEDKIVAVVPASHGLSAKTVPFELEEVIDGILTPGDDWKFQPTVKRRHRQLGNLTKMQQVSSPPACLSPLIGVTPTCLRKAYGVGDLTVTHPDNLQAVIVNQEFLPSDLAAFQSKYGLKAQTVEKFIDGSPTKAETEASLDIQYITAIASGARTWWQLLDDSGDNPFASWLTYMSSASTVPWVQSLSLGASESAVGNSLVGRMNTELAALGARGVTIVFASGDSGYTAHQKFGACSPYVTAVGGVWRGDMGDSAYLAADEISTGGFSSLSANAAPEWQKDAVAHFLTTSGHKPAGAVDATKRCVPDFSLYDDGLQVTLNGGEAGEGGTSCSAPVAGGLFTLINDALLNAGHSTLGFVNPLLYSNEDAFLDITHGMNGIISGFAAVEGYDPASGLGTFDESTLGKLTAAALAAKRDAKAKRSQTVV